jgi:hypothetical protein
MSSTIQPEWNSAQKSEPVPGYCIRVVGHLSPDLVGWLDDRVTVKNLESGEALLFCPTADQAALFGILQRLYSLGLKLLLVEYVPQDLENLREKEDGNRKGIE